jgi:hypothetical protein
MASEHVDGRSAEQWIGTTIINPARTALVFALGTVVLAGRAVRWVADRAVDEGEQQLAQLTGRARSRARRRELRTERDSRGNGGEEARFMVDPDDAAGPVV